MVNAKNTATYMFNLKVSLKPYKRPKSIVKQRIPTIKKLIYWRNKELKRNSLVKKLLLSFLIIFNKILSE